MNDELYRLLALVLGTIISIGMMYIISKVNKVESSQSAQAVSFARLEGVVTGLTGSIDRLHKWRNDLQEREFANMSDQVRDLKKQLSEKDV